MKKFLSNIIKTSVLCSIALIALGILLIVESEATIITISCIIGGILIAIGVLTEINFFREHSKKFTLDDMDILYGLVCIILGIIVIKNPEAIGSIIPLVIGALIIANSAVKFQYSIELKKENNKLWISTLILSIIMILCGIILVFNPFKGAILLTKVVGILVLVYAILDLITTFVIKNTLERIQKQVKEEIAHEIKEAEEKETKKQNKKKKEQDEEEKTGDDE